MALHWINRTVTENRTVGYTWVGSTGSKCHYTTDGPNSAHILKFKGQITSSGPDNLIDYGGPYVGLTEH